jgi:hypothetical protein
MRLLSSFNLHMLIGHHIILWSPYEVAAYYTVYAKIENKPFDQNLMLGTT